MQSILTTIFSVALLNPVNASVEIPSQKPVATEVADETSEPVGAVDWLSADIAPKDLEELLWLSRILYSETKNVEEMRMVAWVVRNRVETKYRKASTYQETALSPSQFSGLNHHDEQYENNMALGFKDKKNQSWQNALAVAHEVYFAPSGDRPFGMSVRHFYSPISVSSTPLWADEGELILSIDSSAGVRFAFYDGVR